MTGPRILLTQDKVQELFDYNADTGYFAWRVKMRGGVKPGDQPDQSNGAVGIKGVSYVIADIMWLYHYGEWPNGCVDHKDRDRTNGRISNLREATHSQNQQNKRVPNPHGFKGVTWRNRIRNPWLAKIRVSGGRINLGSFATKEEAAEAYAKAAKKYHGEFACLEVYDPRGVD